jgi:hypothetical protein
MRKFVFEVSLEHAGHRVTLEVVATSCSAASVFSEQLVQMTTGTRYAATSVAQISTMQ